MRPYMRAANVTWRGIDLTDVKEMNFSPKEFETYQLKDGDILLSEASGSASEVGKPAIWRDEVEGACFQNTLIRVRSRGPLPEYLHLHFFADARLGKFAAAGKGIGINHLGADRMSSWPTALPPLNEQRRIVAKLESVQARSRRAREALDAVPPLLEKLRQSILAAAFRGDLTKDWRAKNKDVEPVSELLKRIRVERRKKWEEGELAKMRAKGKGPGDEKWKGKYLEPETVDAASLPELPSGWCWASADELLAGLRNGISAKPDKETGLRILRISAVRPLRVDVNDVRFLSHSEMYHNYILANGDLLLTRYNGNPGLVGAAAVVRGLQQETVYPDKLIRATPVASVVSADFLALALNTGLTRAHIASKGKSAAGQVGISGSDIRCAPVPVPPLDEQVALAAAVNASLSRLPRTQARTASLLRSLDQLEATTLAKAFRGELLSQDPDDEPAEVMLERLRCEGESSETNPPIPDRPRKRRTA